jgi:hypothetical protein
LPRDIRIEANEVNSGLRVRCRRVERRVALDLGAVFPTAPQDAMKSAGGDGVIL